MPRQARESSGTGIYHVMMRGINHQNIFEEQEDYYQFLDGHLFRERFKSEPVNDMSYFVTLLRYIHQNPIKEKTGATNSSAFQQLPAEIKKSVLIELKGRRASLRQLERLTGIGKSMIYRMG